MWGQYVQHCKTNGWIQPMNGRDTNPHSLSSAHPGSYNVTNAVNLSEK
jgi:hypothetical protein